jgi:D-inositol-3-phosphate glycosyltransferase
MTLPRVVHLVDDTTAGGVMRVLDHILTAPEMAQFAQHSLLRVARGHVLQHRLSADIIVSHLAVSWRALPMLAALRACHPRTAIVHVEHSYTKGFVAANVTHKRRFSALLRIAYGLFNRVVAVSRAQGQWLIESGAVQASALCIIPSCVDLSAFRALAPVRGPIRVIGAIGRLDRQKGFDTLIAAFRQTRCPDVALHIYGEGPEKAALRNLAGNDARIRFSGFAPEPVAAMAKVDAVAMPSNWEAYGLVAIEALAAGRSLLVNDIDGLVDHVPHGARTVANNSVAAWNLALEQVTTGKLAAPSAQNLDPDHFEHAFAANWRHLSQDLAKGRPASQS